MTETPAGWGSLPDAGSDALYIQTATAIYRIDAVTGVTTRTPTPLLTSFSSFVAGDGWVIWKAVNQGSTSLEQGVIIRDGHRAESLPESLRQSGVIYLAASDRLWWLRGPVSGDPNRYVHRAVQLDLGGHEVTDRTIDIPESWQGAPRSDANENLLITNAGGSYQLTPRGTHRLATGTLVAIGKHDVLTWTCDPQARCGPYLTDRDTGHVALISRISHTLQTIYSSESLDDPLGSSNLISPDGRFAALTAPDSSSAANADLLWVIDLRTGHADRLPGTLTNVNPNQQFTWTANSRWLFALTDHQLRGYHTTTHTVRRFPFQQQALHLAIAGQPGQ